MCYTVKRLKRLEMKNALLALNALSARAAQLPGEWPLALHMLEGHAPRFFAQAQLGPKLDAVLRQLQLRPLGLDASLTEPEAMARADARWLLRLRGRVVPPLDAACASECLQRVAREASSLHVWLLGALMGLELPYVSVGPVHDLYWQTHRVLLDTDYLARPPSPKVQDALDALEAALPQMWEWNGADLLGEALFCLQCGGRELETHVERFATLQGEDGSFDNDAHATAVGLLVLAHHHEWTG